jgi:hypothetical protein
MPKSLKFLSGADIVLLVPLHNYLLIWIINHKPKLTALDNGLDKPKHEECAIGFDGNC